MGLEIKWPLITAGYGNPADIKAGTFASLGYGDPYTGDPEPTEALNLFDYYLTLMNYLTGE